MSRVRDALKRSDNNLPRERAVMTERAEPAAPADFRPLETGGFVPPDQAPEDSPRPVRRSFWPRIFRRMLWRFGFRRSKPIPRCTGTTRTGQACRAPAMANGFCRMHGGSRHGRVVQTVIDLRTRVTAAPAQVSDSFGD